jgi:hypothetical protein
VVHENRKQVSFVSLQQKPGFYAIKNRFVSSFILKVSFQSTVFVLVFCECNTYQQSSSLSAQTNKQTKSRMRTQIQVDFGTEAGPSLCPLPNAQLCSTVPMDS